MSDEAGLAALICDDEVLRVHGHANFGSMNPREVVNDGVRKYAVGYHSGHTQLCILMEHGLITKPRPGSYDANLTKKGKAYARAVYQLDKSRLLAAEAATAAAVERAERAEALLVRHREERRLVRAKDSNAVYDTTLNVDTALCLQAALPTPSSGGE